MGERLQGIVAHPDRMDQWITKRRTKKKAVAVFGNPLSPCDSAIGSPGWHNPIGLTGGNIANRASSTGGWMSR
jgi:hypothetical protein